MAALPQGEPSGAGLASIGRFCYVMCSTGTFGRFRARCMTMGAKKILMIVGDYVEDYEVMVPFQALQGCIRRWVASSGPL
jgi:hypothetical protein